MYLHGDEISQQARHNTPSIHLGVCGFYKVMDEAFGGPDNWIARPSVLISSQPAGAVKEDFFNEFLDELKTDLKSIGRVDGVYICEHGGAIATHTHDPDGEVFSLVRKVVGATVPIVTTLDLHANVSEIMMSNADILIGYRTNPHVDLFERGEEAARLLLELFDGIKPTKHRVRLPLVAVSYTHLPLPTILRV